jgi:2-oxoglutarate ferredoxin oxidoreductase subunit delta
MAKGTIYVDQARCKGCSLCVMACPKDVIVLDQEALNAKGYHPAILNEAENACTGCAICAVICPDACITVYREARPKRNPQMQATG